MTDIEKFMTDRKIVQEKIADSQNLVKKYQNQMPDIAPIWDNSATSISFNDICSTITSSGLNIYSCKMDELWAGLHKPSIYDANTLWKNCHDSDKIAGVIDAWVNRIALSPIFLVKHGSLDQGLVADGKHRLTVSRAISASEVPFMAEATKSAWISRTFPSAICIHQAKRSPPFDIHTIVSRL